MATVLLAIGSNLGDREANVQKAIGLLKEDKDIDVLAVSALIETEPVGPAPQGKFLNGAIKIETDLKPLDLLSRLKTIERRMGRVKTEKNAPRSMDLDILFYDDVVIIEGRSLTIPHPRLAERYFVLKPLAEIAPDFLHPRFKKTIQELYEDLLSVPGSPIRDNPA